MTPKTKIVNGVEVKLKAPEAAAIKAQWDAGKLEIQATQQLAYRGERSRAYTEELSDVPAQSPLDAIGDMLDALVKAHYGDATDLDAKKAIIDAIKARHPKP